MSLATRCPACGTVFRVVPDQLRVSEGWVRCGRCNGVFSATEVLFDIDNGTPVLLDAVVEHPAYALADAQPLPPPTAAAVAGHPPHPADEPLTITDWAPADDDDGSDTGNGTGTGTGTDNNDHTSPSPDQAPQGVPLLRQPSADSEGHADAAADTHAAVTIGDATAPAPHAVLTGAFAESSAQPSPKAPANTQADMLAEAPSFLRRAERAAWWHRPRVRGLLGGAVAVLGAALLGQAALINRDWLAARLPGTSPALQALCRALGCQVQPLRRIDALTVDSSALSRVESPPAGLAPDLAGGVTPYRLQMLVHNRADTLLMMPAVELSLTDAQGKLVSRRVLAMAELGVSQLHLAAGQQLPVSALVSAGALRIDGYTVELFYP